MKPYEASEIVDELFDIKPYNSSLLQDEVIKTNLRATAAEVQDNNVNSHSVVNTENSNPGVNTENSNPGVDTEYSNPEYRIHPVNNVKTAAPVTCEDLKTLESMVNRLIPIPKAVSNGYSNQNSKKRTYQDFQENHPNDQNNQKRIRSNQNGLSQTVSPLVTTTPLPTSNSIPRIVLPTLPSVPRPTVRATLPPPVVRPIHPIGMFGVFQLQESKKLVSHKIHRRTKGPQPEDANSFHFKFQ